MSSLLAASRRIDAITGFFGRQVAWLVLAAVLVSAGNAVMRKAFSLSSNAWLELQWYLFGAVFMLAAADTLRRNAHVRIDIVASQLTKRARDWIDLVCHVLFLLPFALLKTWLRAPWVLRAIQSGETSSNFGGLVLWPAKFIVLLGFALLFAQALSEIVKRVAVLRGLIDDPSSRAGPTAAAVPTSPDEEPKASSIPSPTISRPSCSAR